MTVRGRCLSRLDFKRIELVQNGRVIEKSASRPEGQHFVAELNVSIPIDAPAWLAVRTPPPPVEGDAELQEAVAENEFGGKLFSHTSPIYVQLAGQGVFDEATAAGLVAEMKSDRKKIEEQARFSNANERSQVLGVYQEAIDKMESRLKNATQ